MNRSRLAFAASLAGLALLVSGLGCDKASPVAPTGTVLSITVTPSRIAATGESATVRVTALRANGTPVNPGTEVRLETTLGTIDAIVETDDRGIAQGDLRGDGRIGTAMVSARSGPSEAVTAEVEIGSFATNISLQTSPSQVADTGGTLSLLAVVRDDQGRALAGALVNFETDLGTLDSRGALRPTNTNGETRDTLRITEADIQAVSSTTSQFNVTATVGTEGGTDSDTAVVRILTARPIAAFNAAPGGGNVVIFENQTEGVRPLTFAWDFQSDGATDTTDESPIFDYGSPGQRTVILRATNAFGTDTVTCTLNVPLTATVQCTGA
jgi:hypothetical protein